MLTEENLDKLTLEWDQLEYQEQLGNPDPKNPSEHIEQKELQGFHKKALDEIKFLAEQFYNNYDHNSSPLFIDTLCSWLEQFIGNEDDGNRKKHKFLMSEVRFAFILVKKLIYFDRDQFLSLIDEVWSKVKLELCAVSVEETSVSFLDAIWTEKPLKQQLKKSYFVDMSDSSLMNEFRHAQPFSNDLDLSIVRIQELTNPIEKEQWNIIEKFNSNNTCENIFIVEDFSGSGTTAELKIKKLLSHYNFKRFYFCPYIITEESKNKIKSLQALAESNEKRFKLLEGIELEKDCSLTNSAESKLWGKVEKKMLKRISEKYFKSHFFVNGYLYDDFLKKSPKLSTPYGFQNGGFSIVNFRNCPNNSLPIIWADNKNWKPLFLRKERHVKLLKGRS